MFDETSDGNSPEATPHPVAAGTVGLMIIVLAMISWGCGGDRVDSEPWRFGEPDRDAGDMKAATCEPDNPPACEGGTLSEGTTDAGCSVQRCFCPDWAQYHRPSGKCVDSLSPRDDGEPCEKASECQSQFCDSEFVGSEAYGVCVRWCDRDSPEVCPQEWHCVIRNDRDILGLCVPDEDDEHPWGTDAPDNPEPPEEAPYVDISVGPSHACAVRGTGEVACWGNDEHGKARGPVGQNAGFEQVEVGSLYSCGLRSNGEPHCWGLGSDPDADEGVQDYDQAVPADGPFEQITVGRYHGCGLDVDGDVECWGVGVDPNTDEGDADFDQAAPPSDVKFTQIDAGRWHTCGITTSGQIECWGRDLYGETDVPGAGVAYSHVSAGNGYSCAVVSEQPQCWGLGSDPDVAEDAMEGTPDDFDQAVPASSGDQLWGTAVRQIDTGTHHTCGLTPGGHVWCWGELGWASRPAAGLFEEIGVGRHYTCGLRIDGTLDCWGIAGGGVLDHPSNDRFVGDALPPAIEVVDCTRDIKESVITDGFDFSPEDVTLEPYVVVEWENTFQDLADVQTVTSGTPDDRYRGSLFDVEIPVGQSVCLRFDIGGTFDYFSRPHPEMTGSVTHSLQ